MFAVSLLPPGMVLWSLVPRLLRNEGKHGVEPQQRKRLHASCYSMHASALCSRLFGVVTVWVPLRLAAIFVHNSLMFPFWLTNTFTGYDRSNQFESRPTSHWPARVSATTLMRHAESAIPFLPFVGQVYDNTLNGINPQDNSDGMKIHNNHVRETG